MNDILYIQSNLYLEVTLGRKKKWPFKTGDLLKGFNSYKFFYDRTRKRWPFNTGDCMGRSDCIYKDKYNMHINQHYFASIINTARLLHIDASIFITH